MADLLITIQTITRWSQLQCPQWECFDADTGKDMAVDVREYYIPDFTRWKEHDAFEREFQKLLKALKARHNPRSRVVIPRYALPIY